MNDGEPKRPQMTELNARPTKSGDLVQTRESLLSRLKDWDDQQSWRDFFDTYGKLIYALAVKSGFSDSEAQDIVQETVISVAKKMPDFRYDPALGSFKSWLFQITRRRMVDFWRKRAPEHQPLAPERGSLEPAPDWADPKSEALWDSHWRENLVEVALARLKDKVHPRQLQMFDLYVRQGWTMALITSTLGVNAAQVYMAKYRLSKLLKAEINRLENEGP